MTWLHDHTTVADELAFASLPEGVQRIAKLVVPTLPDEDGDDLDTKRNEATEEWADDQYAIVKKQHAEIVRHLGAFRRHLELVGHVLPPEAIVTLDLLDLLASQLPDELADA